MAAAYKTPGVYIEEITKFPPSIAAVETAIPAFIGYTEKAIQNGESLTNKPTRIESIAEYEMLFGFEPPHKVDIFLDTNNQFVRADANPKLFLYDSLRLFYANGGGNCYIISVGSYPADTDADIDSKTLEDALLVLAQEDEPTIILAPDAVSATSNGNISPCEFQKKALIQCNTLKDRVTLCDLTKSSTNKEFIDSVANFRDNVGIQYLKYGAAYGPWIKANLPHTILHRAITLLSDSSKTSIDLNSLTTDDKIRGLIADLKTAEDFVDATKTAKETLASNSDLESKLKTLLDNYNKAIDDAAKTNALTAISAYTNAIFAKIQARYKEADSITDSNPNSSFKLKADIDSYVKASNQLVTIKKVSDATSIPEKVDKFKLEVDKSKNELIKDDPNYKTLENKQAKLLSDYHKLADDADRDTVQAELLKVSTYMINIVKEIKRLHDDPANLTQLKAAIDGKKSETKTALQTLAEHHNQLNPTPATADDIKLLISDADLNEVAKFLGLASGAALFALAVPASVSGAYTAAINTAKLRGDVAIKAIEEGVKQAIGLFHFLEAHLDDDLLTLFSKAVWDNTKKDEVVSGVSEAIAFFNFLETTQNGYEKTLNDTLLSAFGTYKSLLGKAADALNTIPPSGAIAGVYAATDRDRGVWKAPANVSLNAVLAPAVQISHEQQGEFNVDVNAGKSINIIRTFLGKGTLVWGARTLAGNDNEWRYISVRRFFNFVEESVKKATEQFVFEPNDANTWVRVQAMIENFLTVLWRQGALQGIKPEHAFYVSVGIGKTMTALDILEGRMIIEIGMAAVRPAEFIILKFSHKMAES